jgi:hypothetical protein
MSGEAGAEPIEEAGRPSRQHRSLSQIKDAIKRIFALTEAGAVGAVMPGCLWHPCPTHQKHKPRRLLKGLNCCLRRLHLSYFAERKWLLYKKDPKREGA